MKKFTKYNNSTRGEGMIRPRNVPETTTSADASKPGDTIVRLARSFTRAREKVLMDEFREWVKKLSTTRGKQKLRLIRKATAILRKLEASAELAKLPEEGR